MFTLYLNDVGDTGIQLCNDGCSIFFCPLGRAVGGEISAQPSKLNEFISIVNKTEPEVLAGLVASKGKDTSALCQEQIADAAYSQVEPAGATFGLDKIHAEASLNNFEQGPSA